MDEKAGTTTIHDIARELGLNASTVSRGLHDNPAVSAKTRALIKDKAREMNYRPNHMAAALRRGRSNMLGVIVPAIDRFFFACVIRGIEEAADAAGFRVMVCQSFDSFARESQMVDVLQQLRADAIIVSTAKDPAHDPNFYRKLISSGATIQFFDHAPEGLDVPAVVIDDFKGAYDATQHLISTGRKKIAHLHGPLHIGIYEQRYKGFLAAMQDAGLDVPEGFLVQVQQHYDNGRGAFEQLWSLPQPPEAIFSASDYAAIGCAKGAVARGIKIPDQLALVGFANEPFTELLTPALSSVDQQTNLMGRRVAERTIATVKGNPMEGDHRLVLDPGVVVRESS